MFIKKFDHPLLRIADKLDVNDIESKQNLVERLTFQAIRKQSLYHRLLGVLTFGNHLLQFKCKIQNDLEEALAARKLNTFLTQSDFNAPEMHAIYLEKELNSLKKCRIAQYELLKVLYFERPPFKYQKIWHNLLNTIAPAQKQDIDAISLYYDHLRSHYAVSHEDIHKQFRKKIKGRCIASLSARELYIVFKELADTLPKAS